ncbi:MAG: PHP domain-containing protein, partial [Acidimicrobiales bacterium]
MSHPHLLWLAGDHHVHTHYSHDGTYSVARQAEAAAQHGLAWMVITDHGGPDHAKQAVGPTGMDVERAREALPQLLVFQGLEWNVPGSEHGTVFVAPGAGDRQLLEHFEQLFDGFALYGDRATDRTVGAKALEGLSWMRSRVTDGRTASALFLINHPSRRGLVSPRQLRDWHDLCPDLAVGMEGAPGHQDAGQLSEPRGIYDKGPTSHSFPGYPVESYRTIGGFDWMTATVGGVWDALLAEGRRWWVTANSDSHAVASGRESQPFGRDFWPGAYSRTVVGTTEPSYRAVMDGIRGGRMWVGHGDLIWSLEVRVG